MERLGTGRRRTCCRARWNLAASHPPEREGLPSRWRRPSPAQQPKRTNNDVEAVSRERTGYERIAQNGLGNCCPPPVWWPLSRFRSEASQGMFWRPTGGRRTGGIRIWQSGIELAVASRSARCLESGLARVYQPGRRSVTPRAERPTSPQRAGWLLRSCMKFRGRVGPKRGSNATGRQKATPSQPGGRLHSIHPNRI